MSRRGADDTAAEGEKEKAPAKRMEKGQIVGAGEKPPKALLMLVRITGYPFVVSGRILSVIQPFTKWYFDLLKNVLVIAAVSYFAAKTGSKTLKWISDFSLLVFFTYFFSYLSPIEPWLRARVPSPSWVHPLTLFLLLALGSLTAIPLRLGIDWVIHELQRAQYQIEDTSSDLDL